MIKITNGLNILTVTKGAFNEIYSRQGYKLLEKPLAVKDVKEPQLTEDEMFQKELLEKPIGGWTKKEIVRFAELNNVDLTKTKNVNEGRELVKAFLEGPEEGTEKEQEEEAVEQAE